jgi:hypothetical protein
MASKDPQFPIGGWREVSPTDALARASECDRMWFEQNPGRQYRIRRALFGEQPLDPDMIGFVAVRQIRLGARARIGFYLRHAPAGEAPEEIARSWWHGLAQDHDTLQSWCDDVSARGKGRGGAE